MASSPYSPEARERFRAYVDDFKIQLGREAEKRAKRDGDEYVLEGHVERARASLDIRSRGPTRADAAKALGSLLLGFCTNHLYEMMTSSSVSSEPEFIILAAIDGALLVFGLMDS